MISILYFSLIDIINPTGIVDLTTIVVSMFMLISFLMMSSTDDVSNEFVTSS